MKNLLMWTAGLALAVSHTFITSADASPSITDQTEADALDKTDKTPTPTPRPNPPNPNPSPNPTNPPPKPQPPVPIPKPVPPPPPPPPPTHVGAATSR